MAKRHLPNDTPLLGEAPVWNGSEWVSGWQNQNLLTTGEEVFPREACTTSTTLSTGLLRLSYFTARKTETITQASFATSSTAAAATPTLVRYGVYSVATNGDLNLINSTTNDTTLLAATNTAYAKAFSASFSKVAGTRYAVAILIVTGAAAPTMVAVSSNSTHMALAPRLSGALSGQTDLPSSIATGSVVAQAATPQAILLP